MIPEPKFHVGAAVYAQVPGTVRNYPKLVNDRIGIGKGPARLRVSAVVHTTEALKRLDRCPLDGFYQDFSQPTVVKYLLDCDHTILFDESLLFDSVLNFNKARDIQLAEVKAEQMARIQAERRQAYERAKQTIAEYEASQAEER